MQRQAEPRLAFAIMSAIHDNPLRRWLSNPLKWLQAAGLKPGHTALEVGCGPGFFTIPAAKLVGDQGRVVALDIHPLAVRRVRQKARRAGLANVLPIHAEASSTGLRDGVVHVAFLFGIVHRADSYLGEVIREMWRVLRGGGVLAVELHGPVRAKVVKMIEGQGFVSPERRGRIWRFCKPTAG